jgi:hypothetical protein
MKNKKLHFIIIPFLALAFLSCASFSKKRFRKEVQNLEIENISQLNGSYTYNPIKRYYSFEKPKPKDIVPDSLMNNNAYMFLLGKYLNEKDKFDSISQLKNNFNIDLRLENNNLLKIKISDNSKVIKDTTLTGKYKKGMFYLDNSFLDCNGIPYLFGGCRNNKRRIGLTKNGNLLINEAVCNEGAFLLIIGSGYSYNLTYEYKRIK